MEQEREHTKDPGFEIRPMLSGDVEQVLRIFKHTFDPGFDHDWFSWKHREGPWGSSSGWVAEDESGLLGVRLLLPWRFRQRDRVYRAYRPCDTVTVPKARGRGVFRSLTEHAISNLGPEVDFLFNTPNEKSKGGYVRMGFVQWGHVNQRVSVVRPRRAALTDTPEPVNDGRGARTDVDRKFLEWRYSNCPLHDYWIFGLAGEASSGLVCRIRSWHRLRLMVVSELWGDARQKVTLVKGAAYELGARMTWLGEPFPQLGPSVDRRGTLVTRYDLSATDLGPAHLSLGDVEDVL